MTNPLRRSTPEALAEFEEISSTKLARRLKKLALPIGRELPSGRSKIHDNDFGVAQRQRDKAEGRKTMEVGEQRRKQQERFEKKAFLEPTTTFSNSFKKKKHKIPNIKTSRSIGEMLQKHDSIKETCPTCGAKKTQLSLSTNRCVHCGSKFRGARQEEPTSRINPKTPLMKEVPFGRPSTEKEAIRDVSKRFRVEELRQNFPKRRRLKMPSPTQRDRTRIIKARLEKLAFIKPEDRKQKLQDFKQTKQFVENAGEGDEFQRKDRRKQEEEFIGTGRRIRPTGGSMETSFNLRKLHSKLEKLAIVRIPRKEFRESRATRINFVQNFVEKSRDTVKGKNIVPESKALEKFMNKGELINFKEPGARKIDRDVRSKGAVRIRSLGKPPPPIRDEMGELIPKNKRQLAQIKKQQDRIRKELGMGAKGIYCTPCTKRAMQDIRLKIARFRNTPADEIVGKFEKFINKTPSIKGVNGVFDPDTNRILDANDPNDSKLLQKKFGRGNEKIGFNSVTDTRKGPESNIVLIRNQLRKIEKQGGTPALGFDEGSLEAVDVARGRTDSDILGKLESTQRSTGVLTPNKKFKIVDNPNFNM